jgi:hypothetical protein
MLPDYQSIKIQSTIAGYGRRFTLEKQPSSRYRPGRNRRAMESRYAHAVNLKQYRRIDGKWQFVPVVKQNGKPNPKLVLINGEPVSSKDGTFYLDWRGDGKRRTQSAGTTPSAALDAWMLRIGVQSGETEAPEEPAGANKRLTIDQAIRDYLVDGRATRATAHTRRTAGSFSG